MRTIRRITVIAFAAVLAAPLAGLLKAPSSTSAKAAVLNPATSVAALAELPADDATASSLGALLAADAVTASFEGAPFFCFGDVNGDGKTDLHDFVILKANLGVVDGTKAQGDLSGDGIVGLDDFAILKFWFGASSPYLP